MTTRTAQLSVQGMSCANCAQAITDAVEALDGVETASVNYATDEASVEYDPDAVTLGAIYEAVENAGYEPVRVERSIAITDMSCANCADANEDALGAVPGVIGVDVNYATDEAAVDYNPNDADLEDLYDAVEN